MKEREGRESSYLYREGFQMKGTDLKYLCVNEWQRVCVSLFKMKGRELKYLYLKCMVESQNILI